MTQRKHDYVATRCSRRTRQKLVRLSRATGISAPRLLDALLDEALQHAGRFRLRIVSGEAEPTQVEN